MSDHPPCEHGRHLQLADLTIRYVRRDAIIDVSAVVGPGVTLLLGPNGAGKSSLLRVLAGLQAPSSGSVGLAGPGPRAQPRDANQWQRYVGYLPQEADFASTVSVADTVALAAWVKGIPGRELDERVRTALELVGLVDRRRDRVRSLSGGMRRRLGFATAAVHAPTVLLLDEPTAGLDPEQRAAVLEVVRTLGWGRIVLLSTHLLDDLRQLRATAALLHQGRLVFHGDLPQLAADASARLGADLDPGASEDIERAYLSLVGTQAR